METPANQRVSWPQLLLLPLLAVLLFGNCGLSSTRGFLRDLGPERRDRLRALVVQRQALRAAARQRLRGAALQDEYFRIEGIIDARADSLFPSGTPAKFRNRRNKIDRQLLRAPAVSARP
ncbi:MAG TPA: hypothetical protein VF629_10240 [Hymenobacter sp.]|jgi:hypothetical protein|uniref:hypothetical protein n=1 Tax=Hymenobacter sp. TaxID=1898978 RepID=UPI002EDB254F